MKMFGLKVNEYRSRDEFDFFVDLEEKLIVSNLLDYIFSVFYLEFNIFFLNIGK